MRTLNFGEVGTVGGIAGGEAGKLLLTANQAGTAWDLTDATDLALEVRAVPAGSEVVPNGTLAVSQATEGEFTYTPGSSDPFTAASGLFEARLWATQGTVRQASDLFRYSIGAGPKEG